MLFYHTAPRTALQERLDHDQPELEADAQQEQTLDDLAAEAQSELNRLMIGLPPRNQVRSNSTFEVELMEAWMQP